jgi:hypothetical protein
VSGAPKLPPPAIPNGALPPPPQPVPELDAAGFPLPPPPPPIDGLILVESEAGSDAGSDSTPGSPAGKKKATLKRRKSMSAVKGDKVAGKKKPKPTEGPEGNPKNRPRLLANAIRLTRDMYDDPKAIDKTYFIFDAKDTDASINYDDEENDDYNPDYPAVRSAILEKLIVGLTPETYSDPDFIFSFMLSYRTVTTPDRLLQLLQLRWNTPPPHKGVRPPTFLELSCVLRL